MSWGWTRDYVVRPLQAELHGEVMAMCSTTEVRDAPTVADMIRLSGVPERYWYAPPPVTRERPPEVAEADATALARRCVDERTRRGLGRAAFAQLVCVAPGALWRVEQGRVKYDEYAGLDATMTRLEAETVG